MYSFGKYIYWKGKKTLFITEALKEESIKLQKKSENLEARLFDLEKASVNRICTLGGITLKYMACQQ